MHKALLVVDMLNDFLNPEGALFCGPQSVDIIPEVQKLIDFHRQSGSVIIFIADNHKPDDKEFVLFPPHCVAGEWGAETISEIGVLPGDYSITKKRYSAFFETDLEKILKKERVEEVHLCGVCTSICVMDTVSDLRNRDYTTVVHKKVVADFDPQAHEFALKRMEKVLGARIAD